MKRILAFGIVLMTACSQKNSGNHLFRFIAPKYPFNKTTTEITQQIEVKSVVLAGAGTSPCWMMPVEAQRYADSASLADHCVVIEAEDQDVQIPDSLGCPGDVLRFTGEFEHKRSSERTFRYRSWQVVLSQCRPGEKGATR